MNYFGRILPAVFLLFLPLYFLSAAPGINSQLPFSGTLKSSGTPVTGTYDIVFRFYDAPAGGTLLDTSTHTAGNGNAVTVADGSFSVLLGSGAGNALDGVDFNDDTIYLGITVDGDSEMTPRQRLGAAAYAFNSDMLDGYDAFDFIFNDPAATGTLAALYLANGAPAATTNGLYNVGGTLYFNGSAVSSASLFSQTGSTTYLAGLNDNFAIGTTTGNAKLTVWGDLLVGTFGEPSLFVDIATQRVGVNTNSPQGLLSINSQNIVTQWQLVSTTSLDVINTVSASNMVGLSANEVAYADSGDGDLELYRYDGATWSQVGNSFNYLAGFELTVSMARLSSHRIALAAGDALGSIKIRAYEFDDATWSQVGAASDFGATFGAPAIAALGPNTVALVDAGNDELRTLQFNGTAWSQVGNSLAIASVGIPALTTLSPNRVAFIDATNDSLRVYEFDGATWSQVGSGLSINTVGPSSLTTLSPNRVAFIDATNDSLRVYEFNGMTWSQFGSSLSISGLDGASVSALDSNRVALIDRSFDQLRVYQFSAPLLEVTNDRLYPYFSVSDSGYARIESLRINSGLEVFAASTGTSATNGTTSAALTINGSTYFGGDILPTSNLLYSIGNSAHRVRSVWAETLNVGTSAWSFFTGANGRLAFANAAEQSGSEILSLSTGGNVGIGTSSPNAKLTVHGDINLSDITAGIAFGGTRYLYASSTNDSIVFGEGAGASLIASNVFNVAIGHQAMQNATTGISNNRNVTIGLRAGQNLVGGSNVLVGLDAGQNNNGVSNVSIGPVAGADSTGSSNVMIGSFAGDDNTGDSNVLIGQAAGDGNTGDYNVLLGDNAGSNFTGDYSIGLGESALRDAFGRENSVFGTGAGNNSYGGKNTFLGAYAGRSNVGNLNEMIGYEAGYYARASTSVLIGSGAYRGISNFTTSNNVAIGYQAGYIARAGAVNNLLLGYRAADNLTTGANNIVIGYDLDVQNPTDSNTLTLGNVIYATGLTATGTTMAASAQVMIATSTALSASSTLSVAGVIGASNLTGSVTTLSTDAFGNIIRTPSDQNLKTNIGEIENALEKVLALEGVTFEWKNTARFGDQTEIGFIAQEVDLILPEVVRKDGEYWALNMPNMLAVVVEAIEEIWAVVTGNQERISELEARLAALERSSSTAAVEVDVNENESDSESSGDTPTEPTEGASETNQDNAATSSASTSTSQNESEENEYASSTESTESSDEPTTPSPNQEDQVVDADINEVSDVADDSPSSDESVVESASPTTEVDEAPKSASEPDTQEAEDTAETQQSTASDVDTE